MKVGFFFLCLCFKCFWGRTKQARGADSESSEHLCLRQHQDWGRGRQEGRERRRAQARVGGSRARHQPERSLSRRAHLGTGACLILLRAFFCDFCCSFRTQRQLRRSCRCCVRSRAKGEIIFCLWVVFNDFSQTHDYCDDSSALCRSVCAGGGERMLMVFFLSFLFSLSRSLTSCCSLQSQETEREGISHTSDP